MSRGSHRELAINEGKFDEVQTEHLPSFPLLDVVIAEVYQEHGLTWRPLSPFSTVPFLASVFEPLRRLQVRLEAERKEAG